MEALIKARFKSHMVITTVMSNFIMKTRVSEAQITKLDSKVKEVVTATSKIGNTEADLKRVQQDIKSLKNHPKLN